MRRFVSFPPAARAAGIPFQYHRGAPAAAVAIGFDILRRLSTTARIIMPKRKSTPRSKRKLAANGFISIQLSPAEFDAIDALAKADVFPASVRTRAARIRWVIRHFPACHSRLLHAHAVAADNKAQLDNLRSAVSPFASAVRALAEVDAFTAQALDDDDLEFRV